MKSHRTVFLEKVFLGRTVDFNDRDAVIGQCIRLAYKDMLAAGRFHLTNGTDRRCGEFYDLLRSCGFKFSRELIDEALHIFGDEEIIGSGNKYVKRYGLAQKLVNMTYKNFFICSDYIEGIDYSGCDCPLDSVILDELPKVGTVWSKLTKEEYVLCQNRIGDILRNTELDAELRQLGNMAFDFLHW